MSVGTVALIATTLACLTFSGGYLYFLGLRIVRTGFDDKQSAFMLGVIVGSGVLAAVLTLEAVVLLPKFREVSGRLFYAASITSVIVFFLATAGVAGYRNPVRIALANKVVARWGLVVGNLILIPTNILCFYRILPSVL